MRTSGRLSLVNSPPGPTIAVLLAAGAGKRFHGPVHKLMAEIDTGSPTSPEPVVAAALRSMLAAGIGDCVVITGAADISQVLEAVGGDSVVAIHNPDWSSGMRSSVMLAISHARSRGASQIVVGLADQPFVEADAWHLVAHADADIAVATYEGRRGNPVKLSSNVWQEFENSHGDPDAGARSLVERHLETVAFVPCPGSDRDIDTREDLDTWKH